MSMFWAEVLAAGKQKSNRASHHRVVLYNVFNIKYKVESAGVV